MKNYVLLLSILSLTLMSCSKDETGGSFEGKSVTLSATIQGLGDGAASYRFSGGQDVGVFLATEDGNISTSDVARNARYQQSAAGLVATPAINWTAQELTAVVYFPFDDKATANPNAMPFELDVRQDSLSLVGNHDCRNDFLWTRQRINADAIPAKVTMQHLMSKILVQLKTTSEHPGGLRNSKLLVSGTQTQSTVDLSTGTVTPSGSATDIRARQLQEVPADCEGMYEAIVMPQVIQSGTQFFEIKTPGGTVYTWDLNQDLNLQKGKQLVMEVTIDENEVNVIIKDIQDWTENSEIISGVTQEELPTYHLFDYYNRKGIEGIVVSVEDDGKHGWVISLDQTTQVWCTLENWFRNAPKAYDRNDAAANLDAVLQKDAKLQYHPAMKWCNDKNQGKITGWCLPARNVLESTMGFLYTVVEGEFPNVDRFNQAIDDAPVAEDLKDHLPGIKDDYYFFLSSTLSTYELTYGVEGYPVQAAALGEPDYYYFTAVKAQDEEAYVRAYRKF